MIDTGYTPASAFFAGEEVKPLVGDPVVGVPYRTADGKIAMLKSDGDTFVGECQKGTGTGADFDGSACNSKVLSAHYFADDFLNYVARRTSVPGGEDLPGRRRQPRHPHGQHRRGQRQRRDVR